MSSVGSSTCRGTEATSLYDAIFEAGVCPRAEARRVPRHEHTPARGGLPALGPRHHRRGHPARGRARLCGCVGQAIVHRSRGLLAQRELPRTKRLIQFRLEDPDRLLYHDEPIYRNGDLVGRTSSGMWSYVEDRCLAMGYLNHPGGVTQDWLDTGSFEIEVATERIDATAVDPLLLRPPEQPTRPALSGPAYSRRNGTPIGDLGVHLACGSMT